MAGAAPPSGALRDWTYAGIVAAGLDPRELEVADGALAEVKPLSGEGAEVAAELARLLGNHLAGERRPARLLDAARFLLREAPRRERRPDLAVLARERAPTRGAPEDTWPIQVAPDLAIEVRSPADSVTELKRKLVEEYFPAGTREAWVVDPDLQTITVLRLGVWPRSYDRDGTLETPVLPGLRIALDELFRILD